MLEKVKQNSLYNKICAVVILHDGVILFLNISCKFRSITERCNKSSTQGIVYNEFDCNTELDAIPQTIKNPVTKQ